MSWGAQNRSEDAKNPSVAGGRSKKPEPDRCPVQPYFGDVNSFLSLLNAFQCTDACTPAADLKTTATWHVIDGTLVACEDLPDESQWHLVEVARPGTWMIKYSCTDDSGNYNSACRTVYNEGIETHVPTSSPTVVPTSVPTSAPTAAPTFRLCDEGTVHDCDLASTYCGVDEQNGVPQTACPCLPGFLDNPTSSTSCIPTAAPTATPTATPTAAPSALPTAIPTSEIEIPGKTLCS
jgi:hypothetical protein